MWGNNIRISKISIFFWLWYIISMVTQVPSLSQRWPLILESLLSERVFLEWREQMFALLEGNKSDPWSDILEQNDAWEVDFFLQQNNSEDNTSIQCWILFDSPNPKSLQIMATLIWSIEQDVCMVDLLVDEEFRRLWVAAILYHYFENELRSHWVKFVWGDVSDEGEWFWLRQWWEKILHATQNHREAICRALGDNLGNRKKVHYKFLW